MYSLSKQFWQAPLTADISQCQLQVILHLLIHQHHSHLLLLVPQVVAVLQHRLVPTYTITAYFLNEHVHY